jgi:hypothetical protein
MSGLTVRKGSVPRVAIGDPAIPAHGRSSYSWGGRYDAVCGSGSPGRHATGGADCTVHQAGRCWATRRFQPRDLASNRAREVPRSAEGRVPRNDLRSTSEVVEPYDRPEGPDPWTGVLHLGGKA